MIIPESNVLQGELENTNVAKSLSLSEKEEIVRSLRFIHYRKGETIFKQGLPITDIAILMRGLAKMSIENQKHDRGTIISIQGPITALGLGGVIDSVYKTTGEALSDCIVAMISKEVVTRIMSTNPTFDIQILKLSYATMGKYMRQIADFGQKQILARIASVILNVSNLVDSDFIDIQLSRNDLAEYAGISTGSAIRLLSDLEKEGVVVLDKKTIDIKNKKRLIEISQQEA